MSENFEKRPQFPKRAVITAGMPYGNKELHFGHIGGVFIPADVFARFMRDRIGKDNVIFVSGTDCYGSTIEASYEQAVKDGFSGTIEDFVLSNHKKQKQVLESYGISLNLFGASALFDTGEEHAKLSAEVFRKLKDSGHLHITKTKQFYDEKKGVFLNGRQVTGRCPIQGCRSERAYADECSLGHQYNAEELINPISVLSGERPALRDVDNWYFDLVAFKDGIEKRVDLLAEDPSTRAGLIKIMREFLKEPQIYVKKEFKDEAEGLSLPPHEVIEEEGKPSYILSFKTLAERASACEKLSAAGIRYRTGKTVVPFRISGNTAWGIKIPEEDGLGGLTFWVWPESLWAPISFTKAYLKRNGAGDDEYKKWWHSKDCEIFQFIGEDNIYFYGIAQTGLFMALQGDNPCADPEDGRLQLTNLVANHHLLFGKKKASSSGDVKPPKAGELLDYYTAEQLRMHFINASLSEQSVGFEPKSIMNPEAVSRGEFDTVLYEGNLLTNVYNRLVRSCFYTVQKHFDGKMPKGRVSDGVKAEAERIILEYERLMHDFKFDKIFELINVYLRDANKNWAALSREADCDDSKELWKNLLVDSFHIVRVMAVLLHPFAPDGCEKVREYLMLSEDIYSWDNIFKTIDEFCQEGHQFKNLPPRTDFFEKHQSQYK